MAWCHQATSHYLSQCWPRLLSPYGVTRPQWTCHTHTHKNQQLYLFMYFWSGLSVAKCNCGNIFEDGHLDGAVAPVQQGDKRPGMHWAIRNGTTPCHWETSWVKTLKLVASKLCTNVGKIILICRAAKLYKLTSVTNCNNFNIFAWFYPHFSIFVWKQLRN